MLLYYIRHGDPIYNPDSLTPLGQRQAEAVSKRLSLYGIDKIFSSTSNRAYQTAVPTAELNKKEIVQLDFTHEKYAWEHFAVDNGKGGESWIGSQHKYRKLFVTDEIVSLGQKWYEHPELKRFELDKGVAHYNEKIDEFMLSLGYRHNREEHYYIAEQSNSDRVALFAHGGFGGIFLSSLLDMPYPQFISRFELPHTGVTVIEFDNNHSEVIPKVLTFSNDSHLYKEGLPTKYNNVIYI